MSGPGVNGRTAQPSPYRLRLQAFEGPLDLLLHLIVAEELDIHQIPIAHITDQYLEYLRGGLSEQMDVASEFIVMAATLIALKARSLLPRAVPEEPEPPAEEEAGEAELARRLLAYRAWKEAAGMLAERGREQALTAGRLPLSLAPFRSRIPMADLVGDITPADLRRHLRAALARTGPAADVEIARGRETIPERMRLIERRLRSAPATFRSLLARPGRREIVTVFLAVLELIRQKKVRCRQEARFTDIWIEWVK